MGQIVLFQATLDRSQGWSYPHPHEVRKKNPEELFCFSCNNCGSLKSSSKFPFLGCTVTHEGHVYSLCLVSDNPVWIGCTAWVRSEPGHLGALGWRASLGGYKATGPAWVRYTVHDTWLAECSIAGMTCALYPLRYKSCLLTVPKSCHLLWNTGNATSCTE